MFCRMIITEVTIGRKLLLSQAERQRYEELLAEERRQKEALAENVDTWG